MTAITVGAVLFAVASGSSIVDARLRSIALARRVAERHLEKVAGDGARLAKPTGESWPEAFAVRVVDGNGKPVSGARVVWSNPQLGPRSHSGTTDCKRSRGGVQERWNRRTLI